MTLIHIMHLLRDALVLLGAVSIAVAVFLLTVEDDDEDD